MKDVTIFLGKPTCGWLPVDIRALNFELSLEASDLGLNVIDQLYDLMIQIRKGEYGECYFYLEPAAYIMRIIPSIEKAILHIDYLDDFDMEAKHTFETKFTCAIDSKQFELSLLMALKRFMEFDYSVDDWPVSSNESQIRELITNETSLI